MEIRESWNTQYPPGPNKICYIYQRYELNFKESALAGILSTYPTLNDTSSSKEEIDELCARAIAI